MDHNLETEAWGLRGMAYKVCILLAAFAMSLPMAHAADGGSEPKMVSGISIVGNNEAPKSLFIVPWKSSEIGFETNLTSGMMDDSIRPVDKDVFLREIDFYEIRHVD
jgi:hypothetical protein